jgi:hypothetical protein
VTGIGQKRQRTGKQARDRLGDHEAAREDGYREHPLLVGAAEVVRMAARTMIVPMVRTAMVVAFMRVSMMRMAVRGLTHCV